MYGFADLVCASSVLVPAFRNGLTSKVFVCEQLNKTVILWQMFAFKMCL